jgi:radical SAM superfamily enzyme YgiQ (UPF0313 family)
MNVLLVYPEYPDTYWGFKHALKFISKKVANIPLGLITVASLLPKHWNKKLIDLNAGKLHDKDVIWADYVFISAMSLQTFSVKQIINRCKIAGTKIVAGGPLFTEEYEKFADIDHLVLNEAEVTLPKFLTDIENGSPRRIYQSGCYADITKSPIPDYTLVELNNYVVAGIQYSRGCPYDCEFCDITALFGRQLRTKTSKQVIAELDNLLKIGWKESVFFVDDNFIGHKQKLKIDLLPTLIEWMEQHNYPFVFTTEASINLADDNELMRLMVKAGFAKVFVGIETPDEASLIECNKHQNNNRNLIDSVNIIQQYGMEVTAGFIVGFDNDQSNIFQRQIDFIQKSGIISAMVGLLNAPRLSRLYQRLKGEGRLTEDYSGNNTDYSMNFIPIMNKDELLAGYQKIINSIYSSKFYYERVLSFLKLYNPPHKSQKTISITKIVALVKSMIYIGILKRNRQYYWKLLFWSILYKPRSFTLAVTYSIYGYHFRKVFKDLH